MAEAVEYPVSSSQMTLVDWLDDLTVRFLLNLPPAELSSMPRLCFQVEEAQWFYEDFIRPANPQLPSLNLRQFCLTLFQHCPLLSGFDAAQHLAAYQQFIDYKVRVPVRGAILMDDTMEKVLLVRGWKKGANWSFPRGKINKDEDDLVCAMREVYEETGFDIEAAGLVDSNKVDGTVKAIEVKLRDQELKLFVFRGIPLDTIFEPKTRKEIGKIQWYNVRDLPGFKKHKGGPGYGQGEAHANKFYMVAPFLGPLKKWINHQRRQDAAEAQLYNQRNISASYAPNAAVTEDEGDLETDGATEFAANIPTTSADDLKKLLAIGQVPVNTLTPPQLTQPSGHHGAHGSNLLALLQGNQPTVLGQNSNGMYIQQNAHPVFQYQSQDSPVLSRSPYLSTSQQQHPQYNPSRPMINPPNFISEVSLQPEVFDQTNAQPANIHSLASKSRDTEFLHHPSMPKQQQQHHPGLIHHPQGIPAAATIPQDRQSPFAPITTGPQIPEASKLPAPKLSAHSIKLLDAFKSTNESSNTSHNNNISSTNQQKAGSQQQAALLNLFKRAPPASSPSSNTFVKPALTPPLESVPATGSEQHNDGNLRDSSNTEETTRTLPFHLKPESKIPYPSAGNSESERPFVKSEVPKSTTARPSQPFSPKQARRAENVPKDKSVDYKTDPNTSTSSVSILQRPSSRSADVTPKVQRMRTQQAQPSPVPQFSILQRPGSSSGKTPRLSVPQSPLRNEAQTANFQPQVLKRPSIGTSNDQAPALEKTFVKPATGAGKTDHLLALFGKTTTPTQEQTGPGALEPRADLKQRDNLLHLFNAGAGPKPSSSTRTPPPAPQLAPERNISRPSSTTQQQSQQHLLNLFNIQTAVASPNTPISPFTLGTPITRVMSGSQQLPDGIKESRSRLGSMTSMVSSGTNSGRQTPTPSNATPTEAKGVLLDYLNGVVKEGYRGGKRAGI